MKRKRMALVLLAAALTAILALGATPSWWEMTEGERYAHQKARIQRLLGHREALRAEVVVLKARVAELESENAKLRIWWYWGSVGYTPEELRRWYWQWEEEHVKPTLFEDLTE